MDGRDLHLMQEFYSLLVIRDLMCRWGSSTLLCNKGFNVPVLDMQIHPRSLLRIEELDTTLVSSGGIGHMQTIKNYSTIGMHNCVITLKGLLAC